MIEQVFVVVGPTAEDMSRGDGGGARGCPERSGFVSLSVVSTVSRATWLAYLLPRVVQECCAEPLSGRLLSCSEGVALYVRASPVLG